MRFWVFWFTFWSCLTVSVEGRGASHSLQEKAGLKCLIQEKLDIIDVHTETVNGQRIKVRVRVNDDETLGVGEYYEYVNGHDVRPFATAYRIYDKKTGLVNEYLDRQGNGRCEDMIEVPVGSVFGNET